MPKHVSTLNLKHKAAKHFKVIYKTPRFDVVNFQWKGQDHYRIQPHHGGGVNAIVVRRDGKLVMVRQTRPFFDQAKIEIVAGGAEPGEPHAAAVRREVAEETGYKAYRVRKVIDYSPNPAISLHNTSFYIAYVENKPEARPSEKDLPDSRVVVLTLRQVLAAIKRGEIHFTVAGRIFCYLWAEGRMKVK